MLIRYGCELSIAVATPTPALCLVDIHPDFRGSIVQEHQLAFDPPCKMVTSHDTFGNLMRRFVAPPGDVRISMSGVIANDGQPDARDVCETTALCDLPSDVIVYLNGSRYCETDKLSETAWKAFGKHHKTGGTALVENICDFVNAKLRFDYKKARNTRTALEALQERVGVCRDFAHLAIALCRAMNIPARYVNGYLGDIGVPYNPDPMDFNAWFEVYLGGRWYTFDARHNERRIGRITIARGRDASDVPMLQTFGPHTLKKFNVITEEVHQLAA